MHLADLDMNKIYSYADYYQWNFAERIELIRGKIFRMAPAPNRFHQKSTLTIGRLIGNYLQNKSCEVYTAPFDVRFPRKSKQDQDIYTVLQPDVCVICDPSKLDMKGCIGAPDIVVEVLSPGNAEKEMKFKFNVYEEAGVKEYWIVSLINQYVTINLLKDNKFVIQPSLFPGDIITTPILPGLQLEVAELFKGMDHMNE